jgi:DNA-binding GntR family transcriptional regulator
MGDGRERGAGVSHRELVVAQVELIAQSTGTATVEEWAKLDLKVPNSEVLRVTRVRRDGKAVALEEAVLPFERLPGLIADDSDITELAQCYGLSLGRATDRVTIVPATREVAKHLGIALGTDVMKLDRVVETADGKPVEWRLAYRKI